MHRALRMKRTETNPCKNDVYSLFAEQALEHLQAALLFQRVHQRPGRALRRAGGSAFFAQFLHVFGHACEMFRFPQPCADACGQRLRGGILLNVLRKASLPRIRLVRLIHLTLITLRPRA